MGLFIASFYDTTILITPDIEIIESELQHRLKYKYVWFRKQNNLWDSYSNYIYTTLEWEKLIPKIAKNVQKYKLDKEEYFYYTINRWYNYWSAFAIEKIFTNIDGVIPAKNPRDKKVDFFLLGESFDHKTSVYPKGFKKALQYAQQHPIELLQWLYQNQSQQGRRHFENRMFLMVYSNDGEHWKLKAEISWLETIISTYVITFDDSKLYRLQLQPNKTTIAGLIWAIK
ncbi:hypothetical protein [Aquimarina sp. 2201CG5-10]|uniref:hypothetical protein n=1 Tax=Aquimarina callyspongiae TaxID=3098150 RepID=UPI002AB393B4|nr:hypothetical protein [Aquimarina sp. 2201CG5-10]MDY8138694.1 hypothetical protein [Aquimarina sp. 2201CG5-10]